MVEGGCIMPFSDPTNVTSVTSLFDYTNSITGSFFMPAMLLMIWMILFIILKQWRTEGALTSSTFIVMLLSFLMRASDLVGDIVVAFVVIVFLITVFIQVLDREKTPY